MEYQYIDLFSLHLDDQVGIIKTTNFIFSKFKDALTLANHKHVITLDRIHSVVESDLPEYIHRLIPKKVKFINMTSVQDYP